MGRTARERLAKLLDDAQASGTFSAQILAPPDVLQVEVDDVGAVHPPVRAPLASDRWLVNGQIVLTNNNYPLFEAWYNKISMRPPYNIDTDENNYSSVFNEDGADSDGSTGLW